jgi:hypothetical protein
MRAAGFSYWIVQNMIEPPEIEFPFGIDNIAWATTNGFGRGLIEHVSSNDKYFSRLSQTSKNLYALDLNGPGPSGPGVSAKLPTGEVLGHSTSGCIAQADRSLYGNYDAWFKVRSQFQDLTYLTVDDVLKNRSFDVKVKNWSSCMSGYGYTYTSPTQTMQAFLAASPQSPRALSVEVATHEVVCGKKVGLFRTANHLASEFNAVVDRHYAKIIEANTRFNIAALRRARKILGMS